MTGPWTFEWNQLLTIVGMLITVGIAFGGFKTFDRWRREKLEERQIDIAFEALSLAYETKRIFDGIRSPGSFPYEWADMPKRPNEDNTTWEAKGPYFAILKRIEHRNEHFERASKLQPRFMAIFGAQTEKVFDELNEARGHIIVSAQTLMRRVDRQEAWSEEVQRRQEKLEADIWGSVEAEVPDRVGASLERFRSEIIRLCRPVIDRKFRG